MPRPAGTANLPLHGGRVPSWLADRMTRLGAVMSEAIVHHYGREELLRRLAHPFWSEERARSHDYGGRSVFGWAAQAVARADADAAPIVHVKR